MSMPDLKLPRLPDRTPVKMTISIPPDLHQTLVEYAELYRETYGEAQAVQDLVPAMLARFLDSDKALARRRRGQGS
jgi:hypothetical protein